MALFDRRLREVRHIFSPTGSKPRSQGCPAHNLITTLTEGYTSVHICIAYTGYKPYLQHLFYSLQLFIYYLRFKHTITAYLHIIIITK
jgi:hypothetical protein